jgi:hypothetical protein
VGKLKCASASSIIGRRPILVEFEDIGFWRPGIIREIGGAWETSLRGSSWAGLGLRAEGSPGGMQRLAK